MSYYAFLNFARPSHILLVAEQMFLKTPKLFLPFVLYGLITTTASADIVSGQYAGTIYSLIGPNASDLPSGYSSNTSSVSVGSAVSGAFSFDTSSVSVTYSQITSSNIWYIEESGIFSVTNYINSSLVYSYNNNNVVDTVM